MIIYCIHTCTHIDNLYLIDEEAETGTFEI